MFSRQSLISTLVTLGMQRLAGDHPEMDAKLATLLDRVLKHGKGPGWGTGVHLKSSTDVRNSRPGSRALARKGVGFDSLPCVREKKT